ncbi:glycosyl transferase group 1 [Flavobacterium cheongpyeongense]|uniref:Glycosyl transferase group 1 n=1 Tax=Flavobacterium cheongpyeongense TaxID=2212651 RepID=A0A2V4BPP0_9FLAO|nr:glycosyltransferase [Flavobacterium cheongpyeongense]PXY40737.1 glycosyl transferase group 1 [Flavobacterium cheongpyeongense]
MRKVLYFYSENPLFLTQGNNTRAMGLLKYFKSKDIYVDFVGDPIYINNLHFEELKNKKLITNGFLLKDFSKRKKKIRKIFNKLCFFKKGQRTKILDRLRINHQESFDEILKNNQYDYILISYVFWTRLIENSKHLKNAQLIIDTHDFITPHLKNDKKFKLGKYFEEEIRSLTFFDKILVVSTEEKYIFDQFLDKEVHLISHPEEIKHKSKKEIYDLIYVASENIHNVKSAKWFFEKVYPLLSKDIKICIVGKINNSIPQSIENIHNINYLDDLEDVYSVSKIAICPMLSGTGVKIKVIEALSYGLPVVCNERGVDGLLNKTNNGCLVTNNEVIFAAYIEKLVLDEEYYNYHSLLAKDYFLNNHEKSKIYEKLDEIFLS